ncbi:hypothetical protein L6452_36974 [Arctium lappa]|uniref:Uncharacterized protein n=1 Tax=Arctium lappa TaxID=4217 RepID=A0ACB8Y264_ARCLA|nr:hypothetical protein L6452_36974 [Arctium lappa]
MAFFVFSISGGWRRRKRVFGGGFFLNRVVDGVLAMAPKAAAEKKPTAAEKASMKKAPAEKKPKAEKKLPKDASVAGADKKEEAQEIGGDLQDLHIQGLFFLQMVLTDQVSSMSQNLGKPVCIVSSHFVSPYPVNMLSGKKLLTLSDGNFGVTDVNGNLMFKVRGKLLSIHGKRLLVDVVGNRIVTFQKKLISGHKRWQCFRGDSTNPRDHVFTAKQSSRTQFKTSLDVFLASNRRQDVADFKVKGNWFEKRCVVYAGETTTIIAEMNKKQIVQGIAFGIGTYTITVYPNVDYAFVVALMAILNEINNGKYEDDEI